MNMRLASLDLQMEMVQVRWPPFSLENEKLVSICYNFKEVKNCPNLLLQ